MMVDNIEGSTELLAMVNPDVVVTGDFISVGGTLSVDVVHLGQVGRP
jgi:hypothetical protein